MNDIPGLTILEKFISKDEERELVKTIKQQKWSKKLKRWTQHYGYEYDYTTRVITKDSYLGELPEWANKTINKIMKTKLINNNPDQIIVNRYVPGEGISPHIDRPTIFDDQIYSLSLNSGCIMVFSKGKDIREIYLKRRSLLIMEDKARYKWKHSIKGTQSDTVDGKKKRRGTRYSVTFRKVVLT